jgi:hypothetical protein
MCGGDILGGWENVKQERALTIMCAIDCWVTLNDMCAVRWPLFLSTFSFCDDLIIKHGFNSLVGIVGMSTS